MELRGTYEETIAYLRQKGFGGYCDKLYDYKNDGETKSIHTNLDTPKNGKPHNSVCKNEEEAAAIPPGCLLLPIEVVQ